MTMAPRAASAASSRAVLHTSALALVLRREYVVNSSSTDFRNSSWQLLNASQSYNASGGGQQNTAGVEAVASRPCNGSG